MTSRDVGAVNIVFPSDVEAQQAQIAATCTDLGDAIASDATLGLTPQGAALITSWHDVRQRALAYVGESPSYTGGAADQYTRGQALQAELATWYPLLAKNKVPNVPQPIPAPVPTFSSTNAVTTLEEDAKALLSQPMVLAALLVVGLLYFGGRK